MLKARKRDVNEKSTGQGFSFTKAVQGLAAKITGTERLLKNVSAQNVKLINLNQSLSRKIDDMKTASAQQKTEWVFDVSRDADNRITEIKAR